jgi:chromosome segregation ATPase
MNQIIAQSDRRATLSARLKTIQSSAHMLEGRRTALIEQKASTILEIQTAQHYLDHKEEVLNFLNTLQESAQQKTKKMYEDLLTSLIREVLPHKKDRIVFETSIKNNKMSLEVNIETKGRTLNVVLDKGGTIQNIVSMGLRFITVARSRNRKIVLLDEADQWLKTKYIPRFARIVKKLSEELSVQVIYISHHSPDAFANHAKVVTLIEKDGCIYCDDSAAPNIGPDDIGVRYVRLKNFKNHTDTFINLDKHVTVITGEGDIGKSSIIEAFSIVMHNACRDAVVSNGVKCNIELGIEESKTISFEYDLKKSQKTEYLLLDENANPIKSSNDGRNKPVWLDDYLATPMVGDFDIHISNQGNSNFILDNKYSSQKRAEILALDNEAEQIQKIIKLHSEKSSMYQKSLTILSRNLNAIKDGLAKLSTLSVAFDLIEDCNELDADVQERLIQIEKIKENGSRLRKSLKRVKILRQVESVQLTEVNIDFEKSKRIQTNIEQLTRLNKQISAYKLIEQVPKFEEVELLPLAKIRSAGVALRSALKMVSLLEPIRNVQIVNTPELMPNIDMSRIEELEKCKKKVEVLRQINDIPKFQDVELLETNRLNQFASQLKSSRGLVSDLTLQIKSSLDELEHVRGEIAVLQNEMGKCPLCESDFHSHTH